MSSTSPHHMSDASPIESADNGKHTIIIKSRGFNIVWGKDNRYWRVPENKEDPAELVQVSWLEVTGTAKLMVGKSYQVQFEVSMKQDAFGWSGCPVFMMAKLGRRGKYSWKKLGPLDQLPKETLKLIPEESFKISVTGPDTELYFGLYEVWSGKWKGGLLIHKAIITEIPTN